MRPWWPEARDDVPAVLGSGGYRPCCTMPGTAAMRPDCRTAGTATSAVVIRSLAWLREPLNRGATARRIEDLGSVTPVNAYLPLAPALVREIVSKRPLVRWRWSSTGRRTSLVRKPLILKGTPAIGVRSGT